MPNGPIQIANRQTLEALSSELSSAIAVAREQRQSYVSHVEENRELLKPKQARVNPPWERASSLHIPAVRFFRNQLAARLVHALCSASPLVNVEALPGAGPMGKQFAPLVEAFLELVFTKQMKITGTIKRLVNAVADDGAAVSYTYWKSLPRKRLQWALAEQEPLVDDETGIVIPRPPEWRRDYPEILAYDGPCVEYVPIERVGTYPAQAGDLQTSTGVYVLVPMTGNDLLMQARAGTMDTEQVEKMRGAGEDLDAVKAGDDTLRGITEVGGAPGDPFHARRFLVAQAYWLYQPNEKRPAEDWFFTIHPGSMNIMGARPNPWGHGMRPMTVWRIFPDKVGLAGDSVADLIGELQAAMTTLLRLAVDGTAMDILPECYIDDSMPKQDRLEMQKARGPGGFVPINIAHLAGLKSTQRVTGRSAEVLPFIQTIHEFCERALGLSDTGMGKATPRQTTATEIEEMLQEGAILLTMLGDELAGTISMSGGFAEVADLVRWLCYEFAGNESVQELWAAAVGPVMNAPSPMEALGLAYELAPAGTTESTNRALQASKAEKVMALVAQDPLATPEAMYAARANVLNAWGIRDPEKYIGTEEDFAQRLQMAQQQQQMQMQAQQQEAQGQMQERGEDRQLNREAMMVRALRGQGRA